MKSTRLAVAVAMMASATGLGHALTLTVDGVGAGANEYATVKEALIALGNAPENGDGTADTIAVTATIVEPEGFVFNFSDAAYTDEQSDVYPVLLDEFTFDGNNNLIIHDGRVFQTGGDDCAVLVIYERDDVDATFQDVTMIPSATNTNADDGIRINDSDASTAGGSNISLTFDNITMTANDGADNPVGADVILPAGAARWNDDGFGGPRGNGALTHFSVTSGTFSNITLEVANSTFAHSGFAGYVTYGDGLTEIIDNVILAGNEIGFQANGANNSVIIVNNLVSRDNRDRGFRVLGGTTTRIASVSNSVFASNGGNGLDITDADSIIGDITNCAFLNNGYFGLDLYALDSAASGPIYVTNSLFAGNGSNSSAEGDSNSSANIRAEFPGTAGQSDLVIADSTFYGYAVDGSAASDAHIAITWDGADDLVIDVVDSIFAGSAAEVVGILSEGAESAPTGAAINLTNSAVVTAGPDAIAGLGDATAVSGIISPDPQFADTATTPLPLTSTAFDVAGAGYVGAASLGNDLDGFSGVNLVPSLSAARALGAGTDDVVITNPVVVTALLNIERNQFVVQDDSAGITIDDSGDTFATVVAEGDLIFGLNGDLGEFNDLLQLVPDSDASTSGTAAVPAPQLITAAPAYPEDIESELVRINGIQIDDEGDGTWMEDDSYTITAGALGAIQEVRTEDGSLLIGQAFPTGSFDAIGIAKDFRGTFSVQPRDGADIITPATSINDWLLLD